MVHRVQLELCDVQDNQQLKEFGGTMTGDINMANNKILNVADPSRLGDIMNKHYFDSITTWKVSNAGDTMTGDLNMDGHFVKGLPITYPPIYRGGVAISWSQAVDLVEDALSSHPTTDQNVDVVVLEAWQHPDDIQTVNDPGIDMDFATDLTSFTTRIDKTDGAFSNVYLHAKYQEFIE